MKRSSIYLFALLVLYAAVRLPIMLSNGENLDLERGVIAVEFLEGINMPLWDYQLDTYGGGSLFSPVWILPFFVLFGQSLFVLKLAPFCWHLFSLVAWFFVFRSSFSEKKAFFILLFLILPPPIITQFMLTNNGYHFEMILWMALTLLGFRKWIEREWSCEKAGLLLGLLGGFTTWLIATNFVTVLALFLYLAFLREPKLNRSRFLVFYSLFFVVGISPWLFYNWQIGWAGIQMLFDFFTPSHPATQWRQSLVHFFSGPHTGFQGLFDFPSFASSRRMIFVILFVLLYAISFLFSCYRNRMFWKGLSRLNLEVFGLFFQGLLIPLIILKTWEVPDFHYLFPLVPFIAMQLVLLGRPVIAFCLLAAILGNAGLIHPSEWGRTLKQQGYSYTLFAKIMEVRFDSDCPLFREKIGVAMSHRPSSIKKIFYESLSPDCFYFKSPDDFQRILTFIEGMEEGFKPIFYVKVGEGLGLHTQFDPQKLKDFLHQTSIEKIFYPEIYQGAMLALNNIGRPLVEMIQKGILLCLRAPAAAKPACYEGLGLIDDPFEFGAAKFKHHKWIMAQLDKTYLLSYLHGLGENVVFDAEVSKKFLASLKGLELKTFLQGMEEGLLRQEDPYLREEMRANWDLLL